ncbi:DsbE family thiol:disulfide interchange protein [Pseudomonas oryzihabitans]|uniref:DsbE family thiol:disulfide interchange protein n=1 Tax=Pseudomonas oryzihabitans TaxID=47885 RepID=UPI00111E50DA|nr:DsbE family thiol:disulfide interchange protein [Pseudomonas psychrotolerans]QDD88774.1 thiol:disulfide interchange protein [Pseudomonas psychrotolerans]
MRRRLLLCLPLLAFLVLAGFLYRGLYRDPQVLPSALVGQPFPAFSLPGVLDEQLISRQDLLGRPALVNVWGTWCVACREEHPLLNRLKAQGVVIHGVNYKDDNASARRWLAKFHDPYRLDIRDDEGRLGLDLGVYGAPETFLIDAQGIVRYRHVGVVDQRVWDEELGPRYQALVAAP